MRALLIVNGDLPTQEFLEKISKEFEFVAATDGAAARLPESLWLHLICGDFDSMPRSEATARFPKAEVIEVADQNSSDLEKTIVLLREKGAQSITLVGALGGRIDHSLVALSMMIGLHEQFGVSLIDEQSELMLLSAGSEEKFPAERDEVVSLIPLSPYIIVSISGVQWPLINRKLKAGSGGVSNRTLGGEVTVSVAEGCVGLTRSFAIDRIRQMKR